MAKVTINVMVENLVACSRQILQRRITNLRTPILKKHMWTRERVQLWQQELKAAPLSFMIFCRSRTRETTTTNDRGSQYPELTKSLRLKIGKLKQNEQYLEYLWWWYSLTGSWWEWVQFGRGRCYRESKMNPNSTPQVTWMGGSTVEWEVVSLSVHTAHMIRMN